MSFPGTKRSSFGLAQNGVDIYICGGHVGQAHNYQRKHFSREFHKVDTQSGLVKRLADYPLDVQGHRMVFSNGRIYSFGGFIYEDAFDLGAFHNQQIDPFYWYARSTDKVYCFDCETDTWTFVTYMPRPRSSFIAGKVGEKIYLVGGWDGTPSHRGDFHGRFIDDIDVFDLTSNKFVPNDHELGVKQPMRRAFTATTRSNKIIVAGGLGVSTSARPEAENYGIVAEFDPSITPPKPTPPRPAPLPAHVQWDDLPPLPRRLFAPGMCDVDGTLVVMGGSYPYHKRNSEVYLLMPGADSWKVNSIRPTKIGSFPELVYLGNRQVLLLGCHAWRDAMGIYETIKIDP